METMSEVKSDRAPDGYGPCEKSCGRWTPYKDTAMGKVCYKCLGHTNRGFLSLDWAPPLPAKVETAPKVAVAARAKGQKWRCVSASCIIEEGVLVERFGLGWQLVIDGRRWQWDDIRWTKPERFTMTLLSPAPSQPAETPVTIACSKGCGRSAVNDVKAMTWTCPKCEAKPATTVKCAGKVKTHSGAVLARVIAHGERIALCDGCYVADEAFLNGGNTTDVLHDPDIPELRDRRLSHSYGVEDPALEDA